MTTLDMEQRTDEWIAARLGRLTASVAHVPYLKGRAKGTESTQRRDLRYRLACERITGISGEDAFTAKDTQRGIDLEPAARDAYEAATGQLIQAVGFIRHDELEAGCSPDGLIGDDGMVQVKCPKPAIHVGYCLAGEVPEDYRTQLIHELWVSGRQWSDFVSFCPAMGDGRRLLVVRYARRDDEMAAHEVVVRQFLREVAETQAQVLSLRATA